MSAWPESFTLAQFWLTWCSKSSLQTLLNVRREHSAHQQHRVCLGFITLVWKMNMVSSTKSRFFPENWQVDLEKIRPKALVTWQELSVINLINSVIKYRHTASCLSVDPIIQVTHCHRAVQTRRCSTKPASQLHSFFFSCPHSSSSTFCFSSLFFSTRLAAV